jgi:hypothetical protein
MAKEQAEFYFIHGPSDLPDMATQVNMLMSRMASRMDKIEGYLGGPVFQSSIDLNGQPILNVPEAVSAGDVVIKSQLDGGLDSLLAKIYYVGITIFSEVSENPETYLEFGTWEQVGSGKFFVGQDAADTDFDAAGDTGGAKTHKHTIDPPVTTTGVPSATTSLLAAGTAAATGTHTHDVDIAVFDSETVSNLPPFYVLYAWKRTA